MLHLQYGAATNALAAAAAAAPAPTTPLTTFNIPTTSSGTPNGNVTPYALLNGHSQVRYSRCSLVTMKCCGFF